MRTSHYFLLGLIVVVVSCKLSSSNASGSDNKELAALFNNYWEDRMELFPLEATALGDNRYNDRLPIDFTDSYRDSLRNFFSRYKTLLTKYDRESLNENDRISYDIFKREMDISLDGLTFHDNYTPANQFYSLTLTMGQLGSGDGNQPFKTVEDYDNWLKRLSRFSVWTDSAIIYFKKGMETGYVLPKKLVERMVPQMNAMQTGDAKSSLFFGPVNKMPTEFSKTEKDRLTGDYEKIIEQQVMPSYKKLGDFLKNEYLPKARLTDGVSALPQGSEYYNYLIRLQTTTGKTPDEIYNIGLGEVDRIRKLQDSVKNAVGFKGDLPTFFEYMKVDKQFMPYKDPQQVIDAFRNIYKKIQPNLAIMFNHVPKTPFEIRQTEAYRAESASAEYNPGSPDGSRPGIFYVPILDAATFNTTSGMESLFLHEAIPGHHYQISLQQEDTLLPKFRRFGGNNAYVEGWALYCESLGKDLGLYTDPYQYMAALGDEIHRAIRLVVDVAIHTKGMTREEAIQYMMANEAASEQYATMEIERYMAIPGQALGYKIGALKIKELREKYEKDLGSKFNLASFHDAILIDGAMPLDVLERKMDRWAEGLK